MLTGRRLLVSEPKTDSRMRRLYHRPTNTITADSTIAFMPITTTLAIDRADGEVLECGGYPLRLVADEMLSLMDEAIVKHVV